MSCIEVVLFKRFQSHYNDTGIEFGDLVLSIVERYLIQRPFIGEKNKSEFQSLTSSRHLQKLITWSRALQFWRYTPVENLLDHNFALIQIQNIEQQNLHNVAS